MQLAYRQAWLREHVVKEKRTVNFFKKGIGSRLPDAYKKFFNEWQMEEPEPVHYIPEPGKWTRDPETGIVKPVQNIPIPAFVSPEMEDVFTGGERVVMGYEKRKKFTPPIPHFWVPSFERNVIYSEVLNKYMEAIICPRFKHKIHEHAGLDMYLLKTRACDLQTLITLQLKKKILAALLHGNLPYDDEKNQEIYDKYKDYLITPEELEWYGLTINDACDKQKQIEAEATILGPYKHIYRKRLIDYFKEHGTEQAEVKEPGLWQKLRGRIPGLKK